MAYRNACLGLLLVLAHTAGAALTGGLETRAEDGRLVFVSSWWKPSPDWQARWWWREGQGSAWVRAGGFQTGPLIVTSGGDGWRRWYPGTTLSAGYWGAAFDGGPWGVWAVQRPETFEAGAQAGVSDGTASIGLGGDRTWSLEPPKPGQPPWFDRVRSGLTWDDGDWLAGIEATGSRDALGGSGWQMKTHVSLDADPWYAAFRAQGTQDIGKPPEGAAAAVAGWQAWSARWTQETGRPPLWEGRWADDARWHGITWGAELEAGHRTPDWTMRGGLSAAGRADRARWTVSWAVRSAYAGAAQTVTGSWSDGGLEAEVVWRTESQSLGWFGPRSQITLTVRKLF